MKKKQMLGPSWGFSGSLGAILGLPRGRLGPISGSSEHCFSRCAAHLENGPFLRPLLGPFWCPLGVIFGPSRRFWGSLEAILRPSWGNLGLIWGPSEGCFSRCAAHLENGHCFYPFRGRLGAILGPLGSPCRAIWATRF